MDVSEQIARERKKKRMEQAQQEEKKEPGKNMLWGGRFTGS